MHSFRRSLRRRNPRSFLHHLRIPRGSHPQRDRKLRAVPVDHVQPVQQRDVQPRFLHGNVLVVICGFRIVQIEK
jgi:hypothetical protein